MNNISAIIVAKDAPPCLIQSINSIDGFVSEIVVVDIGLDSSTLAKLHTQKKVRITKIDQQVPYVELIREKIKHLARFPYVLFLDPDEIVPPKLQKTIETNFEQYDYMKIPRKNIIFGKWIRYSRWWPDYQVRLFKKNMVSWPPILHAQPETSGKEFVVEPKEEYALIHYNYKNLDEYLEKAARYAKSEAQTAVEHKKLLTFSETAGQALHEFVSRYFAGRGYKDGIHGLILALLQMFYPLLVFFYYVEINKFTSGETDESLRTQTENFFKQGAKETIHWKRRKTLVEQIVKKLL